MNLILLGGNSAINKQWLKDLAAALKPHFPAVLIHHYRHWETGEELIDLDYELDILSKIVQSQDPYTVIAKSAGVLLTLKGVAEKILNPQKCVFVGIPIPWAKANHFAVDSWLKNYSVLTLFIQQSHDPTMSYQDLQPYLEEANLTNYQIVEMPGDDHVYGDLEQLKDNIVSFLDGDITRNSH